MLISFTGAQCTGKTTLLNILKKQLSGKRHARHNEDGIAIWKDVWNFVPEVTRKVKRDGLNINEDGDNLTQLFILKEHLQNHVINDGENWLLDRCILDGYVFTKWLYRQGSVDRWVLDHASCLLSMLGKRLDHILYTEPDDIPIEDDGERSINVEFRNDIIKIYEEVMTNTASTPGVDTWRNKIIRLTGDVDQRLKTIQTILT